MTTRTRTRRMPLLAAAAAALALVLSACAGPAATPSAGSGSAGGTFPATVATAFGDVTVRSAPTRVVALGWGDAEAALALGVQPVGASDWLGFGGDGVGPWAAGRYDRAPTIIATLQPDYEKIAALKPDLILDVKGSGEAQRHRRLASIAPTIGIPKGGEDYLTSMSQQLTMIGTALGVPQKAKALLKTADARVAAVAAAHPQWKGRTATVAAYTSQGWGAYIQGDSRLSFIEALGFTQNPTIADLPPSGTGFSVSLSSERLDDLDADLVVAFPIFVKPAQITDQPLWSALPAVRAGHAIVLDDERISQAFSIGSVLAQPYLLRHVVPLIEKASS